MLCSLRDLNLLLSMTANITTADAAQGVLWIPIWLMTGRVYKYRVTYLSINTDKVLELNYQYGDSKVDIVKESTVRWLKKSVNANSV